MQEILEGLGIRWPLVVANIIGFLLVMAVFKQLLFDPIRAHLGRRRAELEQERQRTAQAEREHQAAERALAERRAEIERRAYERTQELVREGVARRTEALRQAHEQAHRILEQVERELEVERQAALERMREDVIELSLAIIRCATAPGFEPEGCREVVAQRVAARLGGGVATP
ncbi:MAG: hypothetical protein KatS3mg102_1496 [Planctomycetota bacterium]|nr:MAG: hypothetical protein KatS3mg102_1496 [Planctomycetota bacterium]